MRTLHGKHRGLAASDIADWDRVAENYAAAIGGADGRIYTMLRDSLWSSLGPDVSGLDILDLGCGHGWLSALLSAKGAQVRGIDGSKALLAHARRIAPTVDFARYDLVSDALPVDREYDRIVAHMVLMDLPDIDPVLSYVHRVLRTFGRFAFTMPHPCFFNYKTRTDGSTGELYCGVTDYLNDAEWWIDSYGGHRHYHRRTMMVEPPQQSHNPDHAAFYRNIPKFLMIEAQHHER